MVNSSDWIGVPEPWLAGMGDRTCRKTWWHPHPPQDAPSPDLAGPPGRRPI